MFDWCLLSMCMQVILDSPFARLGSAPIWGWKKGEFRDWKKGKQKMSLLESRKLISLLGGYQLSQSTIVSYVFLSHPSSSCKYKRRERAMLNMLQRNEC